MNRRQCRSAIPLLLATALAMAASTQAASLSSPTPACTTQLLRRLGWRIEDTASIHRMQLAAGQPCTRGSLAEAQAAGDLRLSIPLHASDAERNAALDAALNDDATRCAYLFELGDATRRATLALETNPGYRFTTFQLGWIGFGSGGAKAQGWEGYRSLGRGYRPLGKNSTAIDAFYHGRVRSECGVGRQVAQLATQRELYGDAGFDDEFSAAEISIGTFLTLHDTDSILLGRHAGEFFADGKAVESLRMGRQALVGVPGFIEHAYPQILLDDLNNQAQNFVVVDVTGAAFDALQAHGGLAYYDELNRRLWQLARALRETGIRDFMPLLHDRDPVVRAGLDARQREIVARFDGLFADPFYSGFRVYVHHKGVQPIGYHLVRMLDLNPRTPYTIDLAMHNLHTTLFQRWMTRQLRDCAAMRASADAGR